MAARNSQLRYGSVAMTLHWLIAAFVLVNLCLGLYMAGLPHIDPIPPLPLGMNPALRLGARAAHYLLYFLIVAIPLAGWAMVSSSSLGLPTPYFGLFSWPNIPFLAD